MMSKKDKLQPAAIPLIDLSRQHEGLRPNVMESLAKVYASGHFILGPECSQLEEAIANYCGSEKAIGCANGTDALVIALRALGIGPEDEVLVPAFSFFATAEAVSLVGAKPVFVDIDLSTFLIDVSAAESAITSKTAAVVAVHLFGQCAPMQPLLTLTRKHHLALVLDAAQAIGASQDGKPIGYFGDFSTLSFYPTKNLGGMGDGGMMLTSDAGLEAKARRLCNHGQVRYGVSEGIGYNSRLDSFQAAILLEKLPHLEAWNKKRSENAARYSTFFERSSFPITAPTTLDGNLHTFHQYVVRSGSRESLQSWLAQHGIGTAIYYPIPLPLQPAYAHLGCQSQDFPRASQASRECLALPVFPELTGPELSRILDVITQWRP